MAESKLQQRAALSRSSIRTKMDGPKKSAKFGLMCKGKYISVAAVLNTHTKFSKLSVGKNVAILKQRNSSQYSLFPLFIALNDLAPLTRV